LPKFLQNRKNLLTLALVLVLAGGIFVLGAQPAKAGLWDILTKPGQAVAIFFAWFMNIFLSFFALFLSLAAAILEAVFKIQNFTNIPVVNNGWAITRSLANMFFALILLIMAVSTVLGIERYGAKKILPRLIIAALLINFSLMFAGMIIDFAQILTVYFFNAASGGAGGSISTRLVDGLNLAKTFQEQGGFANSTAGADATALINLGIGMLFGAITILIATFVLLAAALFLIVRIVALWLLLIFAPLAWVSFIVPGGMAGGIWGRWWSTFLKYTFFAPVYAFFIYLAVMAISSGSFGQAFSAAQADTIQMGVLSGILNGSVTLVLQYITVIIILTGGLLAAQQLGIYGAGAVMNAGKKAGKAAGKWTARKGTGYDKWAPALMAAGGTVVSKIPLVNKIPGVKKTGDIMKGKAIDMKEKQLQRRENQLYEKLLNKLPKDEVLARAKSESGINALMANKVAMQKNYLKEADRDVVQNAMKTFKNFGMQKELQQLEEMRVDAVVDPKAMEDAFRRALDSGSYKNWSAKVFEDDKGKEMMQKLQDNMSRGNFLSTYNGWIKSTKDQAKVAMKANFKDFDDPEIDRKKEYQRRDLYAGATDNLVVAFTDAKNKLDEEMAQMHIQSRTPAQLGAVGPGEPDRPDMKLIGQYISTRQLTAVRGELSGEQKKWIMEGTKNNKDPEVKIFIDNNLAWGKRVEKEKSNIEVASPYAKVPPPGEKKG